MANTKRQHFVPRVYLKAWETQAITNSALSKGTSGVYLFEREDKIGSQRNKDSILWKSHLYTVGFERFCLYINKSCPRIYADFVNQVHDLLRVKRTPSVYGKMGYSVIKTKSSIRKHLLEIDQWDFFYDDGNVARKKAIREEINALNSYILEDGFNHYFESRWETVLNNFIAEMKSKKSGIIGQSVRIVNEKAVEEVLRFFFMLYCRNPTFDGVGLYKWIRNDLLQPLPAESVDDFMFGIWSSELYRMIYRTNGGFFHSLMDYSRRKLQIILFEVYDGAGMFITSDNPAFMNKSTLVEMKNENGLVFPLTPKYLLFIGKGTGNLNEVDYRYANIDTIRHFNQMIYKNRTNFVISTEKTIESLL